MPQYYIGLHRSPTGQWVWWDYDGSEYPVSLGTAIFTTTIGSYNHILTNRSFLHFTFFSSNFPITSLGLPATTLRVQAIVY